MGTRAIQITHAAVLLAAGALLSCSSIDEGLLPDRTGGGNGGSGGSGSDAGAGRDGGRPGMDGAVADGDAAVTGDGAVVADGCAPSTELCNGADDDCDGMVDENGDEACALVVVNAATTCEPVRDTAFCLNRGCLDGFDNCDGLNENGCEPYCDCNPCEDAGAEDSGTE